MVRRILLFAVLEKAYRRELVDLIANFMAGNSSLLNRHHKSEASKYSWSAAPVRTFCQ